MYKILTILFTITIFISCQQQEPQRVRHLHKTDLIDSTAMAKLLLNRQMTEAADRDCNAFVQKDSLHYVKDNAGFWYVQTIERNDHTIEKGQKILVDIQLSELNGNIISNIDHLEYVLGSGDLPISIARSINKMSIGEQVRIVSPWYTAYGVNGTTNVQPYSNLLIILTIVE